MMTRSWRGSASDKILEWFGKDVFLDLLKDGVLPPSVTPRKMLEHVSATYATAYSNRMHMETVEGKLNGSYDPKVSVEAYFLQLQEARAQALMLGVAYTDRQVMNKALKQFEVNYEKDSYKAEKKWNERDDADKTWTDFKTYWKEQIYQWNMYEARGSAKKAAHQATEIASLAETVSALQAEARALQEGNTELVRQLTFQQAMQAEHGARGPDDDTISTITNQILDGVNKGLENKLSNNTFTTEGTRSSSHRTKPEPKGQ